MAQWRRREEPPAVVKPELALTGLLFYLDTNLVDEHSEAMDALRRARAEGWVRLQRTDVMDTELTDAPEGKRERLLAESAAYFESLGPLVLDHSRLNATILGTDEDAHRYERVLRVLKPGVERLDQARPNDIRDAMHVSTAIRNGASGFVTRDRNILRRADQLAALAPSAFDVLSPEGAVVVVREAAERTVRRHRLTGATAWLPDWLP